MKVWVVCKWYDRLGLVPPSAVFDNKEEAEKLVEEMKEKTIEYFKLIGIPHNSDDCYYEIFEREIGEVVWTI